MKKIFLTATIIIFSFNPVNSQTMNNKKVTAGRDQLGSLAPKFAELNDDVLFGQVWSREQELPARDRSLVTIVSLIAGGNFEQLKFHLQKGKDNGLSKQEIVEVITHQAFYVGWPKAWSAFNIVKEVYADSDRIGNSTEQNGNAGNDNYYMRIAKIVVDSAQSDSYNNALKEQMQSALSLEKDVLAYSAVHDRNNPSQITILETYSSRAGYETHIETAHFKKYKKTVENMVKSLELVDVVPVAVAAKDNVDFDKNDHFKNGGLFPLGEPVNPAWFIGEAWLQMLVVPEAPHNIAAGNVTFSPGARNHWHSHKIGQFLLVTAGEGWYQEWGKPAQFLKAGDVVNIPANAKHWHGATKDSRFVHLAITPGASEWFEPVTDEQYSKISK
jgi:alkylhydroperoxidase/carboxymuconolactone decarboxylase family protein YurZ/quercetin dioxygenase-like cupin family protein/quinol monooxygenase YgiN